MKKIAVILAVLLAASVTLTGCSTIKNVPEQAAESTEMSEVTITEIPDESTIPPETEAPEETQPESVTAEPETTTAKPAEKTTVNAVAPASTSAKKETDTSVSRITVTPADEEKTTAAQTTAAVTEAATQTPEEQTSASAPQPETEKFEFTSKDLDGNVVTMESFAGARLIMFNIWEPWCKYCVGELPVLEKLYENYKDRGLVIVGVCSEANAAQARELMQENGITYPMIYKTKDFNQFDNGHVPLTVFVAPDGEIFTPEAIYGSKGYVGWRTIMLTYLRKV